MTELERIIKAKALKRAELSELIEKTENGEFAVVFKPSNQEVRLFDEQKNVVKEFVLKNLKEELASSAN